MEIDLVAIMEQTFGMLLDSVLAVIKSAMTPGVIIAGSVMALTLGVKFFISVIQIGASDGGGVENTSYGRYELFYEEAEEIMDEYRYEMDMLDTGDDNEYYRQWMHDD